MSASHLMFVYGTLKRGRGNNYLLKKAEFIGPAVTVESYGMSRNGPAVYENAPKGYRAPVTGELYRVDDPTLARLDSLEGHPDLYERKVVFVAHDDGATNAAWLYFMPVTHKAVAHDLFKRPAFVKGAPRHTYGEK